MMFYIMRHFLIIITIAISSVAAWAVRGYRGFVDSSNFLDINIGFIAGNPGDSHVCTGFTTSHGYQFNRWLYVGGGTGFIYNLNWKSPVLGYHNDKSRYVIPIFAEVRLDA